MSTELPNSDILASFDRLTLAQLFAQLTADSARLQNTPLHQVILVTRYAQANQLGIKCSENLAPFELRHSVTHYGTSSTLEKKLLPEHIDIILDSPRTHLSTDTDVCFDPTAVNKTKSWL